MCYFKMQQGYYKKQIKETTKNGSDQTIPHIQLAD